MPFLCMLGSIPKASGESMSVWNNDGNKPSVDTGAALC